MDNDSMWNAIWTDNTKTTFTVTTSSKETITITRGTWLRLPGRDDNVMIDNIIQPYYNQIEKEKLLKN